MNRTTPARIVRGALTLGALTAALVVAAPATAAYTARVDGDTLKIIGDGASDKLVLRPQAGAPTIIELDFGADGTADRSFDRNTFTMIDVKAGAGDDEVRVFNGGGTFADEIVSLGGGGGADTLVGGVGNETFFGGDGDDVVQGGDGDDRAHLGAGDDTFRWNPGDDDDAVEGEGGEDLLDFFGANAGETIGVAPNGSRVRFTRNIANVVMDLDGVERIGYRALGGADVVTVDDLRGTHAKSVEVDLAANGGGGDGQPDTVLARGTAGPDSVSLFSPGGYALVSGLWARVLVTGAEGANDELSVATLDGDDTIATGRELFGPSVGNVDGGPGADVTRYNGTNADDPISVVSNGTEVSLVAPLASRVDTTAVESVVVLGHEGADTITGTGNLAPLTTLTMDGGVGGDVLRGGNGPDLLLGGEGDDHVDGNQGIDRAELGEGDDRFQWDPGDGSDTVEGQPGSDLLDFFGSNGPETIAVAANAGRLRVTRNLGNIDMDVDGVERAAVHALGSTDSILVDDLYGTEVEEVGVDLGAFGGGGDLQPDVVTVKGTPFHDHVQVTRSGGEVLVAGLPALTRILGGEALFDTLHVQTLAGNDDVVLAPDVGGLILPFVDLGTDE